MRKLTSLIFVCLLLAAITTLMSQSSLAQKIGDKGYGGRPPMFTPGPHQLSYVLPVTVALARLEIVSPDRSLRLLSPRGSVFDGRDIHAKRIY